MIKLACKHCDYEWEYKGESKYYASCPRCLYRVKIKEDNQNDN